MLAVALIPKFYDTMMEQLAQFAIGTPPRAPSYPFFSAVPTKRALYRPRASLVQLSVTEVTDFVVDKIMDQANQTYNNAKQYATEIMGQAAWTAVAVSIAGDLRSS